jgi:hypothetical protein
VPGVGERGQQRRAHRVQRPPPGGHLARLTRVQADLEAGRAAHHELPVRPAPVVRARHRRVARGFEEGPRRPVRIDAGPAEDEAVAGEQAREVRDVGLGAAVQRGQ